MPHSSPPFESLWLLDLLGLLDESPRSEHKDKTWFRRYQHWLVEQIKNVPFIYLAVDMGLGKTIAVLTALLDLDEWPVLVVAPKLVATETWPEEIAEWAHTKHLTFTVFAGDGKDREAAFASCANTDLHLVNYENFQWLREKWGREWPYKTIVGDEATRIKGGKLRTAPGKGFKADEVTPRAGNRTSRFGAMVKVRNITERMILMSGTPAPAGLHDLWAPVFLLDRGERLGQNVTAFDRRWFDRNHYNHTIKPREGAKEEITGRLKDIMFALKAEDYVDLPPVIHNVIKCNLPPAIMKRYNEFERTLYEEELDVEAVSQGVLTNKLLQFANGSLYLDDHTAAHVHDVKLERLESVVQEASGEPVLIAYQFKFDAVAIKKRFPKFRIIGDTKNWKKDWDAGRIPGLITHPASAGHGLNLQHGGHIAVFYGLTWNLEHYLQFIARLPRPGQTSDHVKLHLLLAPGTMDYTVYDSAKVKGATQDELVEAVRVRLEGQYAR